MSSATEIYSLRRIYETIRPDGDFASMDDFMDWAVAYYKVGYTVYKRDLTKPYSKKNCYWYYAVKKSDIITSPFCEGCTENMPVCETKGCFKYRCAFVNNWNENICIKPKDAPTEKDTKEYFQYEHPDLAREGICFISET